MNVSPDVAKQLLGFPAPKYPIEQHVFLASTNEVGFVFGFTYFSEAGKWGQAGWQYHVHFYAPQERDGAAREIELLALNSTKKITSNNSQQT